MSHPSFISLFRESVSLYPDRIAIHSAKTTITYKDLYDKALSIAASIDAKESNIGIYTSEDIDTYAGIIAILSLQKTFVPINSKNTRERNLEIISQAGIDLVLSSHAEPDLGEGVRILDTTIIPVIKDLKAPEIIGDEDRISYILFTSGSTGKPKGVPIHERNINSFLYRMLHTEGYDFVKEDNFLQPFELSFDLSIFCYMVPLSIGASFHIVHDDKVFYLKIIEMLEDDKITVALMVPSVINYLQPYFEEIELPHLRLSLFCGEALYASRASGWAKCLPNGKVENVYGPTEATIFFTRYEWTDASMAESVNDIVPIGRPMQGLKVDVRQNEEGSDGMGEVVLIGDQVTTGYYNDPVRTADVFSVSNAEHAYRTGDLGYYNNNGNLIFCGRKDSQIKVNGFRIELAEVEYLTKKSLPEHNIVAVADNKGIDGVRIVLFIEQHAGHEIPQDENLKKMLAEHLPYYMMPHQIRRVDMFPYNLSGKVDRNKLKSLLHE